MEREWLERTELLIKEDGLEKLQNANLLVVGLGGVGSFAAEFLVRAGIGKVTVVDGDDIDTTNRNRQLPALHSTVGKQKTAIVAERLLDINPDLDLTVVDKFLSPEDAFNIVDPKFDYVLDCIDSLSPKVQLLVAAKRKKVRIVSAMGAGGCMDPSKVMVRDISKTYHCKLALHVRKRLKKEGIHKGIRSVFSAEMPAADSLKMTDGSNFKKSFYGTISYMPALFGLYAASEVINYLIKRED